MNMIVNGDNERLSCFSWSSRLWKFPEMNSLDSTSTSIEEIKKSLSTSTFFTRFKSISIPLFSFSSANKCLTTHRQTQISLIGMPQPLFPLPQPSCFLLMNENSRKCVVVRFVYPRYSFRGVIDLIFFLMSRPLLFLSYRVSCSALTRCMTWKVIN